MLKNTVSVAKVIFTSVVKESGVNYLRKMPEKYSCGNHYFPIVNHSHLTICPNDYMAWQGKEVEKRLDMEVVGGQDSNPGTAAPTKRLTYIGSKDNGSQEEEQGSREEAEGLGNR